MRSPEDRESWGFVAATRFDADKAVLDDINPTDAVSAGKGVRGEEELESAGGRLGRSNQLDWNPLGEENREVFRSVRGGSHGSRKFPHVVWRGRIGVFEDACLVGAMSEVLIHTPWLGLGGSHRNFLLSGIVEKIVAASKAIVEFRQPPGCNHFDGWSERVESKLLKS